MLLRTSLNLTLNLAVCLFACGFARAEDVAIVVGIRHYDNGARELEGSQNDAEAVAAALQSKGFRVIPLVDAKCAEIIGAFENAKKSVINPKNDRFVFYYAGHGTDAPKAALMPRDYKNDGTNGITKELLKELVLGVAKARSRTVILDSCYSGALVNEKSVHSTELIARYWPSPYRTNSKGPHRDGPEEVDHVLTTDPSFCCLSAASASQTAAELNINGKRHGLLTYSLLKYLNGQPQVWHTIHTDVKQKMDEILDKVSPGHRQEPILTKKYQGSRIYEPPSMTDVPPPNSGLVRDDFNTDNPDPSKVELLFSPSQKLYSPGELFEIKTRIGEPGYLVVLDQNVDGRYYLLYPESRKVDDASVQPKDIYLGQFGAAARGTESVRAILFKNKERAEGVLSCFSDSQTSISKSDFWTLSHADVKASLLYTARVSFQVIDELPESGPLKDAKEFCQRVLAAADPPGKYLLGRFQDLQNDRRTKAHVERLLAWQPSSQGDIPTDVADALLLCLNLILANDKLDGDTAFKEVVRSESTKKLLAENKDGKLQRKANLAILQDAFSQFGREKSRY